MEFIEDIIRASLLAKGVTNPAEYEYANVECADDLDEDRKARIVASLSLGVPEPATLIAPTADIWGIKLARHRSSPSSPGYLIEIVQPVELFFNTYARRCDAYEPGRYEPALAWKPLPHAPSKHAASLAAHKHNTALSSPALHRTCWWLACFAMGVVTTILMAWAQAALRPSGLTTFASNEHLGHWSWPWGPPDGWPAFATSRQQRGPGEWDYQYSWLDDPAKSQEANELRELQSRGVSVTFDWVPWRMSEHIYGWPITSMHTVFDVCSNMDAWSEPNDGSWRQRLRIGLEIRPNHRRLPLLPVWPGFAIHAAFWSLAAFSACRGLRAFRTAHRRRAGLCTHCRYPVTDLSTCPECAQPVE